MFWDCFYRYFNWEKSVVKIYFYKFKSKIYYQFNLIRIKAANNFFLADFELFINYFVILLINFSCVYVVCVFVFCFFFFIFLRIPKGFLIILFVYLTFSSLHNLNFIDRYFIFQKQWSVCSVNKHHLCTN